LTTIIFTEGTKRTNHMQVCSYCNKKLFKGAKLTRMIAIGNHYPKAYSFCSKSELFKYIEDDLKQQMRD
jgi:hypothetical protein